MKYPSRTHQELLEEISVLKHRVKELEQPETERLRAGCVLLESEALLKAYLENSSDGICISDMRGRFLYGNHRFEEIVGYDRDKFTGRNFLELNILQEKSLDKAARLLQANIEGKSTGPEEIELVNNEGRTVPVEINTIVAQYVDQRIVLILIRDITVHKEAEERLQQQTDAMEASMDGIAILDENQNYVYANEAHARIYNYDTSEELIGKSWRILYDEDELKRFDHDIMPEFSKKGQWRGEATGRKKDGSSFLQEVSLTALYNGGLICVVRDITERKEAERALQESERKFRDLSEKSFVGIYLIQDGIFKYINARLAGILGYSIEEILNKKRPIDLVVSEDVPIVTDNMQKSMSGEIDSLHHKFRVITKNQEIKNVEVFGSSTIYNEKPAVIGTLVDITDRKRTEEALRESESKFRDMAEKSVVGVYLVQDGLFKYANAKFAEIFGYPIEEIAGRMRAEDAIFPEDWPVVEENLRKRISGELESLHYEFRIVTKSRDVRHAEIYSSRTIYRGKPAVIGTLLDITERKNLETQLLQSQKMEAIGTLAGGIAHDFNNILTALMGYASLVQIKMDESSPLRPYVDQVLSASEKAADLTKSLLAFSRQQPVTLVPLDINNTITTTRKLLKRLLTEDIELHTSLTKDDTTVMADRSQIDQILFNLATNARDAMQKGGTLIIGTDVVHVDGDFMGSHGFGEFGRHVAISISDTGEGIDEATKGKIFDPFFTTKEIGKGTGLGLATVYGIVKQHNGHITVYSKPGQGTTFRIYFSAVNMKTNQETGTANPNPTGNETILVAEDNEGVRRFIQEALREHGYKTIEARDGEDAIDKFTKHRGIDLVIIDSVMPRKNGREVYEKIRGTDPNIRVLFTSGYTKDIVLNKGIEDKELDFISKPLSLNELLRKVRDVLDRQ